MGMVSPFAVDLLLPAFLSGLAVKAKPPQKEATLQRLGRRGRLEAFSTR